MLTPMFELCQDDSSVTVTIFAPNARLQDSEVTVNDKLLHFTSLPYYLRLHFPHCLQDSENGGCSALFDTDRSAFVIICKKQQSGQYFPGLDMLTDLLTPKIHTQKPNIEIISSSSSTEESDKKELDDFIDFEQDFWEPQLLPENVLTSEVKYGFADGHSNLLALKEGLYGVLDLPEPNKTSASERRLLRHQDETAHFSDQHYLADLFEEDPVAEHLNFTPHYYTLTKEQVEYTKDEQVALLQLPRLELLVEPGMTEARVLVGLVSVLLSWCYNDRINGGEPCVTSAWNITKLAPQLSWLDTPTSVADSVRVFGRRCMVFPLVRHHGLVQQLQRDAETLLRLGKKQVLKCLLEIRKVFNDTENYYMLNDIYITEYCIWIQSVSESKLKSLADALHNVKLSKADLDLHLNELETVAGDLLKDGKESCCDEEETEDSCEEQTAAQQPLLSSVRSHASVASSNSKDNEGALVSRSHREEMLVPAVHACEGVEQTPPAVSIVGAVTDTLKLLTIHNPLADAACESGVHFAVDFLPANNNIVNDACGIVNRTVSNDGNSSSDSDDDSSSESDSSDYDSSSDSSDSDGSETSSSLDSDDDQQPNQGS